jgi:nitrogen regulatory protein PII
MFLVLFVLNDPEKLDTMLDAWEEIGVPGVTILHSTGLGRTRQGIILRDDLPIMPSLKNLLKHEEQFSRTLFTVVEDENMVNQVVKATQKITGDLNRPDTGLLVVIPLARVYGLHKQH